MIKNNSDFLDKIYYVKYKRERRRDQIDYFISLSDAVNFANDRQSEGYMISIGEVNGSILV